MLLQFNDDNLDFMVIENLFIAEDSLNGVKPIYEFLQLGATFKLRDVNLEIDILSKTTIFSRVLALGKSLFITQCLIRNMVKGINLILFGT